MDDKVGKQIERQGKVKAQLLKVKKEGRCKGNRVFLPGIENFKKVSFEKVSTPRKCKLSIANLGN